MQVSLRNTLYEARGHAVCQRRWRVWELDSACKVSSQPAFPFTDAEADMGLRSQWEKTSLLTVLVAAGGSAFSGALFPSLIPTEQTWDGRSNSCTGSEEGLSAKWPTSPALSSQHTCPVLSTQRVFHSHPLFKHARTKTWEQKPSVPQEWDVGRMNQLGRTEANTV